MSDAGLVAFYIELPEGLPLPDGVKVTVVHREVVEGLADAVITHPGDGVELSPEGRGFVSRASSSRWFRGGMDPARLLMQFCEG